MTNAKNDLLAKIEEDRKNKNEAFDRLSPADKRVSIARDVLQQIWSGAYQPTNLTYFNADAAMPAFEIAGPNGDMQLILQNIIQCKVCAIGAIFASCVRQADKLTIGELLEDAPISNLQSSRNEDGITIDYSCAAGFTTYLEKFFSFEQLFCMEQVFEDWICWASEITNSSDRLMLIMTNIIRNWGVFLVDEDESEEDNVVRIIRRAFDRGNQYRGIGRNFETFRDSMPSNIIDRVPELFRVNEERAEEDGEEQYVDEEEESFE